MKGLITRVLMAAVACAVTAAPAAAQFDKIGKGLQVAKKANDAIYTESEKQQLGAEVRPRSERSSASCRIRRCTAT